jgi:hypothetical protein
VAYSQDNQRLDNQIKEKAILWVDDDLEFFFGFNEIEEDASRRETTECGQYSSDGMILLQMSHTWLPRANYLDSLTCSGVRQPAFFQISVFVRIPSAIFLSALVWYRHCSGVSILFWCQHSSGSTAWDIVATENRRANN